MHKQRTCGSESDLLCCLLQKNRMILLLMCFEYKFRIRNHVLNIEISNRITSSNQIMSSKRKSYPKQLFHTVKRTEILVCSRGQIIPVRKGHPLAMTVLFIWLPTK